METDLPSQIANRGEVSPGSAISMRLGESIMNDIFLFDNGENPDIVNQRGHDPALHAVEPTKWDKRSESGEFLVTPLISG
jgi:hypothetical protein